MAGSIFEDKTLSDLIQKYALRIDNQAKRQTRLIITEVTARTMETSSNVCIIEPLPFNATLPPRLYNINKKLMDLNVYVPIDVSSFIIGCVGRQRCACYLEV